MAKHAKMPKELSMVLIIGLIATVALLLIGVNSVHARALQGLNTDDSFIGQALAALGKCTEMQKTTCKQMQQRCTTLKGTWIGDCNKCLSKCITSRK